MVNIRQKHDANFKARLALEAIKGNKTLTEITNEYGVHGSLTPIKALNIPVLNLPVYSMTETCKLAWQVKEDVSITFLWNACGVQ